MPVPDFQSVMLPLLELAGERLDCSVTDAIEVLSNRFSLSQEDRQARLPSGRQRTFDNRVGWARTYLAKAGLLEKSARGIFKITPRGQRVLEQRPDGINTKLLEQYAEFRNFKNTRKVPLLGTIAVVAERGLEKTPLEALEQAYEDLQSALASDLLEKVKTCEPRFFERLVVDLLLKMGYGGFRAGAGDVTGRSGDGGIDGVINEDKLGLDVVYIQAKRWEGTVGSPLVQAFAGALEGQQSNKGVLITTSQFSNDAKDYVNRIQKKIILIEGDHLTRLMIEHGVGVSEESRYPVSKINMDYFEDQ